MIQPTSFCNLDCHYCYVPNRTETARMDVATLKKLCRVLSNSDRLHRQETLEILWHAGEPLAVGIDYYRRAGAILKEHLPAHLTLIQTFQTNGTLITDEWCRYFIESESYVGVSLDGPAEIHDAQRQFRNGRGSFERVIAGLAAMRRHGLKLNALTVLTPAALTQPKRMFDFYLENQIANLGFNVEEVEGEHLVSPLVNGKSTRDVRGLYLHFMDEFLELNQQHGAPIAIREFRAQSQHLWNRRHSPGFFPLEAEHQAGGIITVSRDGAVFSWSPELASGLNGNPDHFSIGNVADVDSIDELLLNPATTAIQTRIDAGIDQCRRTCGYFNVCGGGSPSNKVYENGRFDSTETVKCRLQVKALTDLILAKIARGPRVSAGAATLV